MAPHRGSGDESRSRDVKVLVTGGSGFIGSAVLPLLSAAGHEVHAHPSSEADLLDPGALDRLVDEAGAEALLHLAWYAREGWADAVDNVAWAESSLRLCRRFVERGGRRVVVAGSCAEYGETDVPCQEDLTPIAPSTLYGAAKAAVFQTLAAWSREGAFSLAWARIFAVYGPGEAPSRLVPSVALPLLRGEPARCTTGDQRRDYLHVHDVASVLGQLVDHPFAGAVNVGSGTAIAVADLARAVAAELGRPDLLDLGALGPGSGPPCVVADPRRLEGSLGWRPSIELADGIRDAVAWWRERTT